MRTWHQTSFGLVCQLTERSGIHARAIPDVVAIAVEWLLPTSHPGAVHPVKAAPPPLEEHVTGLLHDVERLLSSTA